MTRGVVVLQQLDPHQEIHSRAEAARRFYPF